MRRGHALMGLLVLTSIIALGMPGEAQQAPATSEGTLALGVTPAQLGGMAYGAPIRTFEAMGCPGKAREVEEAFQIADSVNVVGGVLGLAAAAALGVDALSLEIRIGPVTINARVGATLASVAVSGVSQLLRWRARRQARADAVEIARLHLDGEPSCFQPGTGMSLRAVAR